MRDYRDPVSLRPAVAAAANRSQNPHELLQGRTYSRKLALFSPYPHPGKETLEQTDLILRIGSIIFPIVAISAVGYFYGRLRRDSDPSTGNRSNMEIFTPALIFDVMSTNSYALTEYGWLLLGVMAVIIGSGLITIPVARLCGHQWKTLAPPMMFNNCGNMGLPLAVLTFGNEFLAAGVLMFVVSNFLHFSLGLQMMTSRLSLRELLTNPMIVATMAAILVSVTGIDLPETLRTPIHMLGQIAIPLMLFSLGMRMVSIDFRDAGISLLGAVLCPLSGLLIALGFNAVVALPAEQASLLVLFSVLPPAVLNYLVAERFGQEPARVASIVLIGNLSSILVVPITLWFLL